MEKKKVFPPIARRGMEARYLSYCFRTNVFFVEYTMVQGNGKKVHVEQQPASSRFYEIFQAFYLAFHDVDEEFQKTPLTSQQIKTRKAQFLSWLAKHDSAKNHANKISPTPQHAQIYLQDLYRKNLNNKVRGIVNDMELEILWDRQLPT